MKKTVSYTDSRGQSHNTAEAATVSDLAAIFLSEKTPNGVAMDVAQRILSNRKEIERIFAEHDEATQP